MGRETRDDCKERGNVKKVRKTKRCKKQKKKVGEESEGVLCATCMIEEQA